MNSICSRWVGAHLERDSVPGVSWGWRGSGANSPISHPSKCFLQSISLKFVFLITLQINAMFPPYKDEKFREGIAFQRARYVRFIIFTDTVWSPLSGFPLFPRRGIPVLQHELSCHTKSLTAISVLDMLREFFIRN